MYAIEPLLVAFPRHAADVAAAVEVSRERGVAAARPRRGDEPGRPDGRPRAGARPVAAHGLDRRDRSRARTARVQPGVVQDDLNRAVAPHGLMFGADTSTSNRATLGGMIGNNSSGTHSVRFGTTRDHVRALEVVLADGRPARLEPLEREEWDAPRRPHDARGRRPSGAARDRRASSRSDPPRRSRLLAPLGRLPPRRDSPGAASRSTSRSSSSARRERSSSSPRPISTSSRDPAARRSPSDTSARPPRRSPPPPMRSPAAPRRSS